MGDRTSCLSRTGYWLIQPRRGAAVCVGAGDVAIDDVDAARPG
jgi:hypothetical protein